VATDAVLKQAIIVNGWEYAVVTRAVAGLICLVVLVIALGGFYGLLGVAVAVLLAAMVTLAMDLRFAVREVVTVDVRKFVLKPIGCGFLVGSVLLLLNGATPVTRLVAGVLTFAIAAFAMRLLPSEERVFLKAALGHSLGRRLPAQSGSE